ncbi:MAG: RagB/SusD family nutrient uptake outer membrane protein [Prevotellaceae bacterium]|nr:RagB/SusD family nutrient uptake outer membrane protein [Prevotellaceae bacterium]
MKTKVYSILTALLVLFTCSCNDFIENKQEQLDKFDDYNYWINETSLRLYAQGCYLNLTTASSEFNYFLGYDVDYVVFGGFFTGDRYNDDIAYETPKTISRTVAEAEGKWNFEQIRRVNIMLEKIPTMDISDEGKEHWTAVGRFFRAMCYSIMVSRYGDVPWYDRVPQDNDYPYLFKPRDARLTAVDKILEDFQYAVEHMRASDGAQQVNKYVAAAFMSRWMLYHGTWHKYHGETVSIPKKPVDQNKLKTYFSEAKRAAEIVMAGPFSIGNTYNELFTSEDLSDNSEIIFFRQYITGVLTNALMSYNAGEEQIGGLTKDALDSYLCEDGLPIVQSSLYQGNTDPRIQGEFASRDPRLYQSFADSLRIKTQYGNCSPTGYICKKFLNEEWREEGLDYINNNKSPADAPIIRFAEVLLNYAEATFELSAVGGAAMTQNDLDISINLLRKRQLKKDKNSPAKSMPDLKIQGGQPAVEVSGVPVVINDPNRDADVDPLLWEIRRERRVELIMEGRRNEDLNRWGKYDRLNTGSGTAPTATNMGAWVVKAEYPEVDFTRVKLYHPTADQSAGYIWPAFASINQREFIHGTMDSERNYIYNTIPISQINLYKTWGYTLTQNPGWPDNN